MLFSFYYIFHSAFIFLAYPGLWFGGYQSRQKCSDLPLHSQLLPAEQYNLSGVSWVYTGIIPQLPETPHPERMLVISPQLAPFSVEEWQL